MNALTKALQTSRACANSAYEVGMQEKSAEFADAFAASVGGGMLGDTQSTSRDKCQYKLNRGWLYSAVHALSLAGAQQPVNVARMLAVEEEDEKKRKPSSVKSWAMNRMTATPRLKMVHHDLEIVDTHPVLETLENPNPIQSRFQFVYTFLANLNLTGWAFLVADFDKEGELLLYSLPTTWVHPIHDDGPFSHFKVYNPKDQAAKYDAPTLDRNMVAFAHLPNPSDPLSAIAPSSAQIRAIRIDDHIQTSQDRFFNKGIFPSAIISIGREPHPQVTGGVRPRLSAAQRRQVHSAIRKTMAGVENYGEPAIVDGLIEKIERLSATSVEMGWKESEQSTKTRILSAYAVHPFMLGEPTNIGGYAQAFVIREVFNDRVNAFLDMLGNVATNFIHVQEEQDSDLLIWWDKKQATDPSIEAKEWQEGRKNGDVSRDEFRARLGLPPSEEESKSKLLETVGGITGAVSVLTAVGNKTIPEEAAIRLFVLFFNITEEEAKEIVSGFEARPNEVIEVLSAMVDAVKQPVQIDVPSITVSI